MIATLGIKVENGQIKEAVRSMDGLTVASAKTERATQRMSRRMGLMQIEAQKMDRALTEAARASTLLGRAQAQASQFMARFGALLGAAAAYKLAQSTLAAADAYSTMTSRLALVTKNSRELADVQGRLFAIAQEARTPLEQTALIYERLARNATALGMSQTEVLRVTETINKAMVVSGSSGASAAAALTQLSQAFASGTLRGEELNSVLEQAPRLAQAIADGMGVSVGQLRELGKAGELSAKAVTDALIAQSAAVDREFSGMAVTVGGAMTRLRNAFLEYVGTANQASGATSGIAAAINAVADATPGALRTLNAFFGGIALRAVDAAIAFEKLKIAAVSWAPDWMLNAQGRATKASGAATIAALEKWREEEYARITGGGVAARVFGGGGRTGAATPPIVPGTVAGGVVMSAPVLPAPADSRVYEEMGRVFGESMGKRAHEVMVQAARNVQNAVGGIRNIYEMGQNAGSATHAGGWGAAQGAMIGNTILPGGIGAAVGALAGFTAGMLGFGKASAEATRHLNEARRSVTLNLEMMRAEEAGDSVAIRIIQEKAKFDALRKQIEEAYGGRKAESERERYLREVNAAEARRISLIRNETAALEEANRAMLNLAAGFKGLPGIIYNAIDARPAPGTGGNGAPRTPARTGPQPDTPVLVQLDGETIMRSTVKHLQRKAAQTFGDSSQWSQLIIT